jgi:hypothetical protein
MAVDYGTDMFWDATDLSSTGALTSGITLLVQRAFRRLDSPRGSEQDAPDDGLDLTEFLSAGLTPSEIDAIPGQVEAELRKDEVFTDVTVTRTALPDGFNLAIRITPSSGPDFEFVLGVEAAGTKLLSVTQV